MSKRCSDAEGLNENSLNVFLDSITKSPTERIVSNRHRPDLLEAVEGLQLDHENQLAGSNISQKRNFNFASRTERMPSNRSRAEGDRAMGPGCYNNQRGIDFIGQRSDFHQAKQLINVPPVRVLSHHLKSPKIAPRL